MSIIRSRSVKVKAPWEIREIEFDCKVVFSIFGEFTTLEVTSNPTGLTFDNPIFVGSKAFVTVSGGDAGVDYEIIFNAGLTSGSVILKGILQIRE